MNLHGNEKEFFRLMGLPLPMASLYPHYLEMMSQRDYRIKDLVDEFNNYAKWVLDMGYSSCQNYRIDHAAKAFESWTKANDPLKGIQYDAKQFREKDHRKAYVHRLPVVQQDGVLGGRKRMLTEGRHPLFSVDMAEANYSVMKLGAQQKGIKVPQRWSEFCDEVLRIHPFLAQSKVFRQHCFGAYNPKACASVQKSFIQSIVDEFDLYEKAVLISPDEIVMPKQSDLVVGKDTVYEAALAWVRSQLP